MIQRSCRWPVGRVDGFLAMMAKDSSELPRQRLVGSGVDPARAYSTPEVAVVCVSAGMADVRFHVRVEDAGSVK